MPTSHQPDSLEIAMHLTAGMLAGGALNHLSPEELAREGVRLMNQVRQEVRNRQALGTIAEPQTP